MEKIWIPQLVIGAMLVWALNPANPYGYYVLLRWVCCGVFVYLAFQAFDQRRQGWVWILGITAGIYNPIVPVHLTREIWSLVNVITMGVAIASIFTIKLKSEQRGNRAELSPAVEDSSRRGV